MLLIMIKLIVMSIVFLSQIFWWVLKLDYTCLGGSWNGKVWEPLFYAMQCKTCYSAVRVSVAGV